MKKVLAIVLAALMLVAMFAGCAKTEAPKEEPAKQETAQDSAQTAPAEDAAVTDEAAEPVTIRWMSNLPDRTSSAGLIEQTLLDQYQKEHPNVTIEVEALDDDNYNIKFKAYASSGQMPDVFMGWTTPQWMSDPVNAGLVEELNVDDYSDYGFIAGALECATFDGKLYALPKTTDSAGFFYNKDVFAQYGIEIPQTWDELLAAAKTLTDAGITPCAMPGQAEYLSVFLINALIGTVKGEDTISFIRSSIQGKDFSDPVWEESAAALQDKAGELFQFGWETTDYGTAVNMFQSGETAMLWMGSWEMSMAPEFNVGFFPMPDFDGDGEGAFLAYHGTGQMVSSSSKVKDEAMKLLNWFMEKQNFSAMCWQNGVCMSGQNFNEYLTGNETPLQLDVVNTLQGATSTTGTPFSEVGHSGCDLFCNEKSVNVISGIITPDEFIAQMVEVP